MRIALRALALIPMAAGAATVVLGSAIITGAGAPGPSVESELRFYGAWWVGAGLFLWWLAPEVARRRREVRVFAGLLALGATGRLIGLLVDGEPHWQFAALMVIEYAIAAALLALASRAPGPR